MADENLVSSCLALQSVSASIQTMLGPNKSLKCYLSSNGDSGILGDTMQVLDALMASYRHHDNSKPSPSPSLSPTSIQCPPPALQLLYECCREHQRRVGCGTTTLICLSAFWGSEILNLAQQDVPLPVVFAMLREVLCKCKKFLSQLSLDLLLPQPVPAAEPRGPGVGRVGLMGGGGRGSGDRMVERVSRRQMRALSFSRHFGLQGKADSMQGNGIQGRSNSVQERSDGMQESSDGVQERSGANKRSFAANLKKGVSTDYIRSVGERLGRGRELAMRLAVEARLLQIQQDSAMSPSETLPIIQVPHQYCVVGKAEEHSRLVRGVVTDLHPDMLSIACAITTKKLNILVLEGDCSPHWKHLGLQRKAGHVTSHDLSLLDQQSSESKWLAQSMTALETFDIDVLVVGGTIWPLLWQQCIGAGVVVLKEIPASVRTALSAMTGARPLSYLSQCSKECVGGEVVMEVLEAGWVRSKVTRLRGEVSKSHCCRLFKAPSPSGHAQPAVATTTAILCGLTECGVDSLRHQLTNSAHRLHWATTITTTTENGHGDHTHKSHSLLLPGNGHTEAAVIRMLENEISNSQNDSKTPNSALPLYFTHSWMSLPHVLEEGRYRAATYQAFADGLRKYLIRCLMNARPGLGQFEARTKVEEMIREGGTRNVRTEVDGGDRNGEIESIGSGNHARTEDFRNKGTREEKLKFGADGTVISGNKDSLMAAISNENSESKSANHAVTEDFSIEVPREGKLICGADETGISGNKDPLMSTISNGNGKIESIGSMNRPITDDLKIEGPRAEEKSNFGADGTRFSTKDPLMATTGCVSKGNSSGEITEAEEGVDVFTSKLEAWKTAVHLLETIFLLKRVSNRSQ